MDQPARSTRLRPVRPWPLRALPLGRIGGFRVYLSPAWLVLAVLVTVAYRYQAVDGLPAPAGYALGAAFVALLLASVLLHELGHALVCRRYGVGVRAITLEMLGGYTEMERDAPRPRVELFVSLAGPAVSLALGGLVAGFAAGLPAHSIGRQLAVQVAASNIVVAAFNALPGLPLDGGRALQALVWAVSRDPYRGHRVAGWAGWLLALLCAGAALVASLRGWISLIGAALIMIVALTVGAGAPLAVVDEPVAAAVPAGRREEVRIDSLARGLDPGRTIPAGLRGADVLRAVQGDPAAQYLVTSGEDVVGVLRAADVARLLAARGSDG